MPTTAGPPAAASPAGGNQPPVSPLNSISIIPTQNPLAAFATLPTGVDFAGRDPHEKVILLLRQHPATNLRWLIMVVAAFIASLALFNSMTFSRLLGIQVPARVFFFANILLYLLLFAYTFERFLFWFFNIFIVTDRRLVDIDFHGLLALRFAEVPLNRIQDISLRQRGLAESFLDFGDVIVQTAATEPNIDFTAVPHPARIVQVISSLVQQKNNESRDA